jgi:hypothetical protein
MDEGEEFYLLGKQGFDGRVEQCTVIKHGNVFQRRPGALGEELPGHQIAVMLHAGKENDIAGTEILCAPGVGNEVDALRGAAGEDDLVLGGGAKETCRFLACRLKGIGRPGAQLMQRTMDVGIVTLVIVRQCLNDGPRLLAGGRAVQIDQRVPLNLLVEDGKIGADAMPVHDFGPRQLACRHALTWCPGCRRMTCENTTVFHLTGAILNGGRLAVRWKLILGQVAQQCRRRLVHHSHRIAVHNSTQRAATGQTNGREHKDGRTGEFH